MHYSHVIGLDLEAGVLHLVEVRRRFLRPRELNAYRLRLPAEPAEARLVLERFARAQKIRRVPCVLGMSTATTLLRLFALPPVRRRTLAQRVQEKLEQFRTIPLDGALEAYTLLRSPAAGLRMLIGLTRREALDRLLELPAAAGWNVVGAVPTPLAAFQAAASLWPRRSGAFLCLHLRHDKTLLAAGHGDDLLQLWTCPLGADHLLPDGVPTKDRDVVERWIQEIQACLPTPASDAPAAHPAIRTLLLSGAGPLPPEWIRKLAQKTERRVLRLEETPQGRILPDLDRFGVAYGLALAGLSGTPATLSLIPPALKERLALRWQFKYWLGCAAVVLLGLGLAAGSLRRSLDRDTAAFEQTRRQLRTFQALDETLRETTERNRALRRQLNPLLLSVRKGATMREILAAVAEAKHADDWISLIADGPSYFTTREQAQRVSAAPPPGSPPDGETRPAEHLVVEGFTPVTDFSTIRGMIETLRSHPLVSSVDLLGDDKVMDDDERDRRWSFTGARRFALEIKINGLAHK